MSGTTKQQQKKPSWQKVQSIREFVEEQIVEYRKVKKNADFVKKGFDDFKFTFNDYMDKYFDMCSDDNNKIIVNLNDSNDSVDKDLSGVNQIILTRVTPSSVEFDVNKLKGLLDVKQKKQVIGKKYEVINWLGLLTFLKDSGIDFREFKKYVNITEVINVDSLDKLVELGLIDSEEVKKCSSIKLKSPYYKLTEK